MLGCRPHVWWWWGEKIVCGKLLSLPSTLFVTNPFPWFNVCDLKNLFHRPYFWLTLQVIPFNRPCQKWLMIAWGRSLMAFSYTVHMKPLPQSWHWVKLLLNGNVLISSSRTCSYWGVTSFPQWQCTPLDCWRSADLPDLWDYLANVFALLSVLEMCSFHFTERARSQTSSLGWVGGFFCCFWVLFAL